MTFNIPPALIARAAAWEVYEDDEGKTRCRECDQYIFNGDFTQGRLRHITHAHGYRLDGRRYDNENRVIVDAGSEESVVV